jgi:hypothetical protein|tara:strand:- start:8636 stop:8845 length:210 start_codon:yes stop_codon:yes gene_type:complete
MRLNVEVPDALYDALKGFAAHQGESVSTVVRGLVREHLTANGVEIERDVNPDQLDLIDLAERQEREASA